MEKIKIDDFTRYKFLSGLKHSPSGEHACFAVHESDLEENKYLSNLWIYNRDTNNYFKLTSFNTEKSFTWIDNENIIFPDLRNPKDKEKKDNGEEFTQYYKINIHGGEAAEYFRIQRNVSLIKMIDEDTFVFASDFNSNVRELNSLSEEEKAKELKARKEEKDYEVLEEIPFWANGGGFTNRKRNRLYIYNKGSEKVLPITDEYTDVENFVLNKDRTRILFVSHRFTDVMGLTNDIFLYDLKEKTLKQLTKSNEYSFGYAEFIGEDKIIVSGSDMKSFGENENHKFYLLDINSCNLTCLTPDFDKSLWHSVGSDCRFGGSSTSQVDGQYFYFVTTENDSAYLNRIDVNGRIETIIDKKGAVDGISVSNGSILFIGMRPLMLQELYILNAEEETQITHFNDWVYSERSVANLESISVDTAPGVHIDGWVMRPVDFDEKKKYPAILDIHGGPKTVYGELFFHEMQYWANEGYVVFFCNPRGSDGKGNEFADIRGKYGTIDYDDIMKFMDEVLNKFEFIDGDRVGVTGGSYGGYMTNWIIGHTDRFKAAASQRSISNWISKFCTTDIGYFFVDDQNGGTPWNNQEKLWWHSPLKYADKVKTPTLFLHSEEDYRCWLAEGIQMFAALKYHGVESRLIMFRAENHELSRSGKPKHRLRRLREITDWFNHYLKNN